MEKLEFIPDMQPTAVTGQENKASGGWRSGLREERIKKTNGEFRLENGVIRRVD